MRFEIGRMLLACAGVLLAAGCGPRAPAVSLHAAVQDGNYAAVRQHIGARTDLNTKNSAGLTALHVAASKGDLPMVRLLTEAGADPTRTGPGGKTPADVARERGHTAIVEYLQAKVASSAQQGSPEKRGRRLIDGGLGVSDVMDAQ